VAIVPLRQTVTITPASAGTDDWGKPLPVQPFDLACRVQEHTKLTIGNSSSGNVNGVITREAVSRVQIYFDKLAPISYDDVITFTDENGTTHTYKPLNISVKRGLNGKPILTVVEV
jgi:hypothetical protein